MVKFPEMTNDHRLADLEGDNSIKQPSKLDVNNDENDYMVAENITEHVTVNVPTDNENFNMNPGDLINNDISRGYITGPKISNLIEVKNTENTSSEVYLEDIYMVADDRAEDVSSIEFVEDEEDIYMTADDHDLSFRGIYKAKEVISPDKTISVPTAADGGKVAKSEMPSSIFAIASAFNPAFLCHPTAMPLNSQDLTTRSNSVSVNNPVESPQVPMTAPPPLPATRPPLVPPTQPLIPSSPVPVITVLTPAPPICTPPPLLSSPPPLPSNPPPLPNSPDAISI